MKKLLTILLVSLLVFTGCGESKENKANDDTLDLSSYKKVWRIDDSELPTEEIVIKKIDGNKVLFDYVLYRLGEFNDVEGTIKGNVATFSTKNDMEWTIGGTLKFENDSITINITESSIDLIAKTENTFKYKGDNSIIREGVNEPDPTISE
jgi:major membrane immunogen (membrane-anchored lipoprotein)